MCHVTPLTSELSGKLILPRAERFGVTVDFLIRQVAYLTEQHASQVRDELRKAAAAAKGSAAPSPVPGSEPAMGHQRVPSSLSIRKDFMFQRNEASGTGTPIEPSLRPDISRNTSGNSPAYSHNLGGGSTPRPATREGPRPGETLTQRRRMPSFPVLSPNPPSPGPADSSSDDSDDSSPAQSRIIRRPPRFQPQDEPRGYGYDDDDVEPAFQAQNHESSDLNSTLRGDGTAISGDSGKNKGRLHQSQTSDSSTGSTAVIPRPQKSAGRGQPGPISPRAAQLAGRSPGGKSKAASRVGSDGTRSMGSSFSDLEGMYYVYLTAFSFID